MTGFVLLLTLVINENLWLQPCEVCNPTTHWHFSACWDINRELLSVPHCALPWKSNVMLIKQLETDWQSYATHLCYNYKTWTGWHFNTLAVQHTCQTLKKTKTTTPPPIMFPFVGNFWEQCRVTHTCTVTIPVFISPRLILLPLISMLDHNEKVCVAFR